MLHVLKLQVSESVHSPVVVPALYTPIFTPLPFLDCVQLLRLVAFESLLKRRNSTSYENKLKAYNVIYSMQLLALETK